MKSDNLQSIARKVKALLAKTQESGCTESEALEAAAKAQQLMETYQLDMSEIELQEEGVTQGTQKADPRSSMGLGTAVGNYCDVRNVRSNKGREINFLGLRSDVELATWLMASLETFVASEALGWMLEQDGEATPGHMDSFVIGAYSRIKERLNEETRKRKGENNTGRNALVVTKNALIAQHPQYGWFANAGRANYAGRVTHEGAALAGAQAGNSASFGRPVGQRSTARIGYAK